VFRMVNLKNRKEIQKSKTGFQLNNTFEKIGVETSFNHYHMTIGAVESAIKQGFTSFAIEAYFS
jgi:hypothetical protein